MKPNNHRQVERTDRDWYGAGDADGSGCLDGGLLPAPCYGFGAAIGAGCSGPPPFDKCGLGDTHVDGNGRGHGDLRRPSSGCGDGEGRGEG